MDASGNNISSATASTPRRSVKAEPAQFRIVCPSIRTGAVIGKGGSTVRHIQGVTGAKIRLLDDPHNPPCEDRVIIISHISPIRKQEGHQEPDERAEAGDGYISAEPLAKENEEWGPVRKALARVFDKIIKGDSEEDLGDDMLISGKLLVGSSQAGSVLGKGGKILEKVRSESGAQHVRVLPRDHIPPCAFPGDELIEITGSFGAVKRGLLYISTCLQDETWTESSNFCGSKPASASHPDYHSRSLSNMGTRGMGGHNRKAFEEDVVFKLLCHSEKVGSLIGKGGCVVRSLEHETGASIKMAEAIADSDERVVVIAARENSEQAYSPAQDAVLRVHTRLTEIGFERGSAVVARLLVHPHQIGRLLGKNGQIISEMRQMTGASIRIFPKEKAPKFGPQNDEVVHVIGSFHCVQDALYQITGRLREIIFPIKVPFPSNSRNFSSPYPEMHHSQFRPRHAPESPAGSFSYSSDRSGQGQPFDRSPRSWSAPSFSKTPRGGAEVSSRIANQEGGATTAGAVEVVVPEKYLGHVYGENSSTLNQIRQISGANVTVTDPKPGATEGLVVLCGSAEQMHTAQMLLHAFILCGEAGT